MTGPKDPSNPERQAGDVPGDDHARPTSVALPEPEPIAYDTGSDAWWRAQAQAGPPDSDPAGDQPAGAERATPETTEEGGARRQAAPSPLDRDWFPQVLVAPAVLPGLPLEALAADPVEPQAPVAVSRASSGGRPTPPTPAAPVPSTSGPLTTGPRPQVSDLAAATLPEPSPNGPPHDTEPVGPKRALAGAAIALIGVLLGVGALYLFHKPDDKGSPVVASPPRVSVPASARPTTAPSSTPSASASTAPTVIPPVVAPTASPAAAVVPVSVLNNSKITGLADRGAARFRAGGWPVKLTGNYRGGAVPRTTVYYAPGGVASAQRFARQFGIARVAPRFAGLPTTGMTVLLTRDYR